MSSKVLSIGLEKHIKIIQYNIHNGSAEQFKQVGVRKK